MKITFRTESGADQVSFVQITAPGTDSVFYAGIQISTITLPLNPSADVTRFVFIHDQGTDSLEVSYQRQVELVNPDCGTQVFYGSLSVDLTTFSEVNVLDANLQITDVNTRDVVTNLEIYR